jgi:integrase/recombinase XerD
MASGVQSGPGSGVSGREPSSRLLRFQRGLGEFLLGRTKKNRESCLRLYRHFAAFRGARAVDWEGALSGFYRLGRNEAYRTKEAFRGWLRERGLVRRGRGSALHLGALASFLKGKGFIAWDLPHGGYERARSFLGTCPAESRSLIKRFIGILGRNGCAKSTGASRRHDLVELAIFLDGEGGALKDLSQPAAERWVARLRSKGLADRTLYAKVWLVRSFGAWLEATGAVPENPVRLLRWKLRPLALRKTLDEEDVRNLAQVSRHPRDRAVVHTLYATACWSRELRQVNVSDLLLRRRLVRIPRRPPLAELLPLTRSAAAVLKAYLPWRRRLLSRIGRRGEPALFVNDQGRRLSSRSLGVLVRRLAKIAGLPRPVTPKTLRHSFGTHFLDRGGDLRVLQEILGHWSAFSTAVYSRTSLASLRDVYDHTHPRA